MQQVVEHLASLEQRRNSLREVGVAGGTVGVGRPWANLAAAGVGGDNQPVGRPSI